jgi:hypothetical protein
MATITTTAGIIYVKENADYVNKHLYCKFIALTMYMSFTNHFEKKIRLNTSHIIYVSQH